jgi:hypothetical protein
MKTKYIIMSLFLTSMTLFSQAHAETAQEAFENIKYREYQAQEAQKKAAEEEARNLAVQEKETKLKNRIAMALESAGYSLNDFPQGYTRDTSTDDGVQYQTVQGFSVSITTVYLQNSKIVCRVRVGNSDSEKIQTGSDAQCYNK